MPTRFFSTLLFLAVALGVLPNATADERIAFFESKIRPVLIDKCYKCHSTSGDKVRGGLLLDHREALLNGGDSGPAIVPGDPNASLLIEAIRYEDPDYEMPPKERLAPEVVRDFEIWVSMGAPDPREKPDNATVRNVLYDESDAQSHWAFQLRATPTPPVITDADIQNPIDAFIRKKLNAAGIEPSPQADRHLLMRRLSYNITGLQPSQSQLQRWGEATPISEIIEELLGSPEYGVHWARRWLDVARYADQAGMRQAPSAIAPFYPHAWTYRDWVIAAFNRDLPYDQFITHQLAGDAFTTDNDLTPAIGLGFLRVGKLFGQNMDDRIDDRIDALSKGFLGLTVACARCHDHKFDPIPTADYYSLHGILSNSEEVDILIEETAGTKEGDAFVAERDQMIADAEAQCVSFLVDFCDEHITTRVADYLLGSIQLERGELTEKLPKLAARELDLQPALFEEWVKGMDRLRQQDHPVFRPWFEFAERGQVGEIDNPILADAIAAAKPTSIESLAAVYHDLAKQVSQRTNGVYSVAAFIAHNVSIQRTWQTHIPDDPNLPEPLADPNWEELRSVFMGLEGPWGGKGSNPRALLMAGAGDAHGRVKTIKQNAIKLAGNHPGAPILAMGFRDTAKPEDSPIYIRGDKSNPGDIAPRQFLAALSTSPRKVYTQGSGRLELARDIADPDNPLTARVLVNRVWHWHFGKGLVNSPSDFGLQTPEPTHPELLDWLANWFVENGWSIRKLNRLILSSATWQQASFPRADGMESDPANDLIWRMNPRRLTWEEQRDSILAASGNLEAKISGRPIEDTEDASFRTAFLYVNRYNLPYDFQIFDFANPDSSVDRRESSIIPQQALYFLNDPWINARSQELARLAEAQEGGQELQLHWIWEQCFQRSPTPPELEAAKNFLVDHPMTNLAQSLLSSNEFSFVR